MSLFHIATDKCFLPGRYIPEASVIMKRAVISFLLASVSHEGLARVAGTEMRAMHQSGDSHVAVV